MATRKRSNNYFMDFENTGFGGNAMEQNEALANILYPTASTPAPVPVPTPVEAFNPPPPPIGAFEPFAPMNPNSGIADETGFFMEPPVVTRAPTPPPQIGQVIADQTGFFVEPPVVTPEQIINPLTQQILGQGLTGKWTGAGHGSAEANARDMAKILSGIGITDIKQFGKVPQYAPAREAYKTYNGRVVQETFDEETGVRRRYTVEPDGVDEEGYPTTRIVDVPKDAKLQSIYAVDVGPDDYQEVDASKIKTVDGKLVADTGKTTFGNKLTGQTVPNTYSERQQGDFFGGTFEGKGNTGYGVKFDDQGNPYFYTQGASSNDLAKLMQDLGPMFQIGMALATGGLTIPQQIAAQMAVQVLSGQDIGTAIKNAAVSLAVAQIPGTDFMKEANKYIGTLDLPTGLTNTLNSSFQNAAMSGARALLTGQDVSDAMLKGAAAGGTSGAVGALMKQIPDFDKLSKNQQRMATNAVIGVVSGRPLDQIVINAAIAAANAEVAEQKKNPPLSDEDRDALPPDLRKIYDEGGTKGLKAHTRAQAIADSKANADVDALTKVGLVPKETDNVVVTGNREYDDFLASIGITNPSKLKDSGLSNQDIEDLIHGRTPVKKDDRVTVTAPRETDPPYVNPIFQTPVKPKTPNLGDLGTITVTAPRPTPSPVTTTSDPVSVITNPLPPTTFTQPVTTPVTTPVSSTTSTPTTPAINIDPVEALQQFYNPFKPTPQAAPVQSDTGPIQLMTDIFGTNIATAQKTGARGYGFSAGGDINELLRLLRS